MNRLARILIVALMMGMTGAGPAMGATSAGQEGALPLGAEAPDFTLPDLVTGAVVSRDDFAGKKALLVIFICRHCPYVQHVNKVLAQMGRDYANQDVGIVAISANDADAVPRDAPASLRAMAQEEGFTFPFLYDESQQVAKAYTAVCTPDPFLFDAQRRLVYRGRLDDTRPGGRPATAADLRAAMDTVPAGRPVNPVQKPSVGCSIKWKRSRLREGGDGAARDRSGS